MNDAGKICCSSEMWDISKCHDGLCSQHFIPQMSGIVVKNIIILQNAGVRTTDMTKTQAYSVNNIV